MSWFTTVEADVVKVIQKVEMDVQTADKELKAAFGWVANQLPKLAVDAQLVAQFVASVPVVGTNPEVLAAVSASNVAIQGLNLIVQNLSQNKLTGPALQTAVTQGYATYKQTAAAINSAMHAAVSNTSTAKGQ